MVWLYRLNTSNVIQKIKKSCIHLYLTPNCQWKTLYQIRVPSFQRHSVIAPDYNQESSKNVRTFSSLIVSLTVASRVL